MISAKQAQEQSESGKVKLQIDEIDKSIKNAIKKGRTEIFKMSQIGKEIEEQLTELGYSLEVKPSGTKISW